MEEVAENSVYSCMTPAERHRFKEWLKARGADADVMEAQLRRNNGIGEGSYDDEEDD